MESGRPHPFSFSLTDPELPIGMPDFSLEGVTAVLPKIIRIKICKAVSCQFLFHFDVASLGCEGFEIASHLFLCNGK